MSEFNYREYLRNNPLLKPEGKTTLTENQTPGYRSDGTPKSNAEMTDDEREEFYLNLDDVSEEISEAKNIKSYLKDLGTDAEIEQYMKSLAKSGDDNETEDDYIEDFKNYIADKSLDEAKPSTKMKVSELKAKIKEDIIATLSEQEEDYEQASREVEYGISPELGDLESELMADLEEDLNEAKEDEEEDIEVEDEVDIENPDMGMETQDEPAEGLSNNEQDIQNSLKVAYDNAVAIGDEKLADQIGNTITFFTRTHVVER